MDWQWFTASDAPQRRKRRSVGEQQSRSVGWLTAAEKSMLQWLRRGRTRIWKRARENGFGEGKGQESGSLFNTTSESVSY